MKTTVRRLVWVSAVAMAAWTVLGDVKAIPCSPSSACDAAVTFKPGESEVVIGAKASQVVAFAAAEATNFLSRVLGAPVPIVHEPTPGKASLVLGVNRWSTAAGLDPEKYPRDTFLIRAADGKVFIVGEDGASNPRRASVMSYPRGTMHGVYAFLEDYAGCRFYFPGELGEVAPRRAAVTVPAVDRVVTPQLPHPEVLQRGWCVVRAGKGNGCRQAP